MAKRKVDKIEELSYEAAFGELEALVEKLESGDLPLEEALELFERGQALAARCTELLENAELTLKKLAPGDSADYTELDFEEEPS